MRPPGRFFGVTLAAFLAFSCAGKKVSSGLPASKAAGRAEQNPAEAVQRQLRAQNERIWAFWTEGKPLELEQTYSGRERLYSQATLRELRSAEGSGSASASLTPEAEREQRARRNLLAHLDSEVLARELRGPSQALANLEATLSFGDGQRELPLNDLDRQLAGERNSARRHAMYRNATPAFERLGESIRRRDEATQAIVSKLGYPDLERFGAEIRDVDLTGLAAVAESILHETEAEYFDALDKLARRELKVGRHNVKAADLPFLFRVRGDDRSFTGADVLSRAEAVPKALGIPLPDLKGVRWDVRQDKPHHAPLTLAVDPPHDVRVSLWPLQGALAQGAVLHEVGHALRAVSIRERRFELVALGNPSFDEGSAALFGELVEDPHWLQKVGASFEGTTAEPDSMLRCRRLFRIRRAAGLFLFELELRRQSSVPFSQARALYGARMTRALGISHAPDDTARAYAALGELFGTADLLRSGLITLQLRAQLERRFGKRWWEQSETGRYLQTLWAPANALEPEELLRRAGEPGLRWIPEGDGQLSRR